MTEEEIIAAELAARKPVKKVKPPREKKAKPPKIRKEKIVKSESQLVHEYVDRVIGGKVARGHVDDRFAYTRKAGTVNKELWLDTDFFCSIVFQSFEQKYEFLEALAKKTGVIADLDDASQIQIVNGMDLARRLGIELKRETRAAYPIPDLELRPFIMDDEVI